MDPSANHDPAETRRVQPDGSVLFCGTSLRIRVAILKPGFVLVSARGELGDAEDARAEDGALAELDREFERAGTLTLFADLRESARIPAVSREKWRSGYAVTTRAFSRRTPSSAPNWSKWRCRSSPC